TLLDDQGLLTGTAIAIDKAGNAHVGGRSNKNYYDAEKHPLNGIQPLPFYTVCPFINPGNSVYEVYCPQAGYLAALDPTGGKILWATYLGGGNVNANFLPAGLAGE